MSYERSRQGRKFKKFQCKCLNEIENSDNESRLVY